MNIPVDSWFWAWIEQHRSWNPGRGWNTFEAGANPFVPWVVAFRRHRVTEAEATAASCALTEAEPSYPEHHLHRLLTLIHADRAGAVTAPPGEPAPVLAARAEEARRAELSAIIVAEWSRLDEEARESWRLQVREASSTIGPPMKLAKAILEAQTQQAHAESLRPELRRPGPDGRPESTLDYLRRVARTAPPAAMPAAPAPRPPALSAEQELAARERADESRRALLAGLTAANHDQAGYLIIRRTLAPADHPIIRRTVPETGGGVNLASA